MEGCKWRGKGVMERRQGEGGKRFGGNSKHTTGNCDVKR